MFQKVKNRFRDKIFSNPTKKDGEPDGRGGYSGDDLGSSFGSSSSKRGAASPSSRKESDVHMAASPDLQFLRKSSATSLRHNSPSHAESPTSNVLPPVQISNTSFSNNANGQHNGGNSHANNHGSQAHPKTTLPPQLQGLLSPVAGSGRRKSTPAALDMALRTDEGKRAVEELLQGAGTGNKKLVFGQYFAGSNSVTPTAKAAEARKHAGGSGLGPASPNSAAAAAAAGYKLPPAPGAITAASVGLSPLTLMPTMNDLPMTTVMEDEDTDEKGHALGQQIQSHKTIDSASSYDPATGGLNSALASPNGKSAAAQAHAAAQVQQHAVHAAAAVVAQAAVAAAPSREEVMEDAPNVKRTKIISMSPALPASMARKYWQLSDYNIMRKMYTGYASTVYQAMCKKTLEMVALKVYHMENLCELNHYQVYREVRVHSMLSHQHIIHLYCAFQEGMDVVLVQEYAEGGDLYRLLHKNGGRLAERQAVEMVLHPFLLSLHYLHTRGIMHRDIKPENVLFTEHRVLKLADFGLAIDLTEERAVTRAGTLDYMAPEVLRCPPKNLPQENKNNAYLHYNNSVDAWAVGVFAYELVVGFPPFAGETQLDSVDKIMNSVPEFPDKMSELAKDFVCQALKKHPGDRPTVMEMLHHPWIRTFQRRTSMRITAAPRRRSSVTYNPPSHGLGMGAPTQHAASHAQQYNNHEQIDEGPMEGESGDVNEMTPEQIESMIRRLQVAKQQAIARESNGGRRSGNGPQPMQT